MACKHRLFPFILALVISVSCWAQNISDGDTLNVAPRVKVGDSFSYTFSQSMSMEDYTELTARDFTLDVTEMTDSMIVMRMTITNVVDNNTNPASMIDPFARVFKECIDKIASGSYDVLVDSHSGKYLGIRNSALLGHNAAVELMNEIEKTQPIGDDEAKAALRASMAYVVSPETILNELPYLFYLGFEDVVMGERTTEDSARKKVTFEDGCLQYECEIPWYQSKMKINLGPDNMLSSLSYEKHDNQTFADPDGTEQDISSIELIVINRTK